jgi:hypothetical protein
MSHSPLVRLRDVAGRLRAVGREVLGRAWTAMLDLQRRWRGLSAYRRLGIAVGVGLAGLLILVVALGGRAGCDTRTDAEARLGAVMGALQQEAAQGYLALPALAQRVIQINTAATTFEQTGDAQAYCDALDAIRAGERYERRAP